MSKQQSADPKSYKMHGIAGKLSDKTRSPSAVQTSIPDLILNLKFIWMLWEGYAVVLTTLPFDNPASRSLCYAALGLVHDLNPSASGGAEPLEETIDDLPPAQVAPDSEVAPGSGSMKLPQGYGRIIRDDAGNVLRVELPEQDQEGDNTNSPGRDIDMETLEPDVDQKVLQKWVADLGGSETRRPTGKDGDIVKELERLSAVPTNKTQTTLSIALTGSGPRHTAKGELEYLLKLVEKHGKDAEKMAKDRKLNPDQRTTGELRRALKRAGLT
ncbi:uncharacterized protein ARMOST_07894 [Armillaria ostoyae]|uniref:Nucleolar protein 16 n=1 Tax=Armillaria ostoyae TaxID=47428 RepID=A0A284R734_ARMOS|nr:uncharacterized protein ARMOST_07894 [Armillaria ostoyae]